MFILPNKIPYARHQTPRFVYFLPHFSCGLYCRAVSVTDNLCTKQENSSILGSKIRGLKLKAVTKQYSGARTVHSWSSQTLLNLFKLCFFYIGTYLHNSLKMSLLLKHGFEKKNTLR